MAPKPPAPPKPQAPPPPPAAPPPPAPPSQGLGAGAAFIPAEWDPDTVLQLWKHGLYDAFYTDERNTAISREKHPIKRFWNIFTGFKPAAAVPFDYNDSLTLTTERDFPNPLIDASLALPEKPSAINPVIPNADVQKMIEALNKYRIFVPKKLSDSIHSLKPSAEKPTVKIALFFGVADEINSFGLRKFFDNTSAVLICVPSTNSKWGMGITTQMIRQLLDGAGLQGIDFSVEVMAGYSGAYRGLNETIINDLVELKELKRLVYFDAFYNHDDTPLPNSSHPFYKKNTLWAIDVALTRSPTAELFIYGYTMTGTPRATKFKKGAPPPPLLVPIDAFLKKRFPARVKHFIDLEYDPRIIDEFGNNKFECICLARLIQSGIDESFQRDEIALLAHGATKSEREKIASDILALVDLLPERGSLGMWGRSGFIDFFNWVTGSPQKAAIAQFPADKAFQLVFEFKLLGTWTRVTSPKPGVVKSLSANNVPNKLIPGYWLRHVDFVQEISKESLLP